MGTGGQNPAGLLAVTRATAKTLLMGRLPSPSPSMSAAECDAQLEAVMIVGWYTLDRWVAEDDTVALYGHLKSPQLGKRVQAALDNCSTRHFAGLEVEATLMLKDYVARRATFMNSIDVNQAHQVLASQLETNLTGKLTSSLQSVMPPKEKWWAWTGREAAAALIGNLALIVIALLISALLLTVPKVRDQGLQALGDLLGIEVRPKSAPPSPDQAKGQVRSPAKSGGKSKNLENPDK